ncbi:hypothetical protein Neosp_005491 [[Neocosmospora] mangrovei]
MSDVMSDVFKQMIDRYYRKWGFTIYRTYYGNDENWQELLHSLRHQTKLAFGAFEDAKEIDQDVRRKFQESFYLDVRDDPSQLDGLDVRGLRKFCNAEKLKETEVVEKGGTKLRVSTRPRESPAMADHLFNFILLADEAVLKDIEKGESIVKAVSLLWDGNSGWGWMRIPTGYLLELWTFLMWNDDRTEYCLCIGGPEGPEGDLEDHIWAGDVGLHCTGRYSEIRRWRHYSTQKDYMYQGSMKHQPELFYE